VTTEWIPAGTVPGRVRWRCRRGQKELDLLLARWSERRWGQADGELRARFERLLEWPDADLADCLLGGRRHPDPALAALLDDIVRGPD